MRSPGCHLALRRLLPWLALLFVGGSLAMAAASSASPASAPFPPPLESYGDAHLTNLVEILKHRIQQQPFNLWATLLFLGAIIHTFLAHRFRHIAHVLEERLLQRRRTAEAAGTGEVLPQVSAGARFFHFLGEIEAIFGIWAIPLLLLMLTTVGRTEAEGYINQRVNFTEAIFVVVIMAVASTHPILQLAENTLRIFARLGAEKPVAWWLAILTVGPLLGSFITEPAAMTICASLLAQKFYAFKPSPKLAYGSLGLLFVNISVGGTLTHFAAPPVLMVAGPWNWTTPFMLKTFGWKAALGILLSVIAYYLFFRQELHRLGQAANPTAGTALPRRLPIPVWVTVGHLLFLVFAVLNAHKPPVLIFTLLFFLAFTEVTEDFQRNFQLRSPILVGFFLAGLVIHGGLQQWWIAPVLGQLSEVPLMLGATFLTAFNDNAAITYLCTLVPSFTEGMKYAAVAGAVTGGGLTVIANAPNPAGQSILNDHFEEGIGATGLFLGALVPTVIVGCCFMLLR